LIAISFDELPNDLIIHSIHLVNIKSTLLWKFFLEISHGN
jgi:hypothetical protein